MAVAEKPEGMTDRDWTQAKSQNLTRAHYMIGRIYFDSQQWSSADRALRAVGPGGFFDAIDLLSADARSRLAAYAKKRATPPLAGFWTAADLTPGSV